MLQQRHRFHGYGSLKSVYQRGENLRGPLLSLRFARRDPKRPYRVAVVVSRKVSKSAVIRNRIRRRLYEAVRTSQYIPQPGTDLVLTVFDEKVATTEAAQLRKNVDSLLKKVAERTKTPA